MAGPRLIPVFISYSSKDKVWRDLIASSIKQADLDVLDDTLLLPSQDWAVELQTMRGRARAAILIVTQNFLGSYTIQSSELPHLVMLQKSNGLRLIPVIAEPCDWQSSDVIKQIQVFPEFGKPLASDPKNVDKELHRLSEKIIQLLMDDSVSSPTQPQPTSHSQSTSRSQSSPPLSKPSPPARPSSSSRPSSSPRARFPTEPSSQSEPSVAQLLALRFKVRQPTGEYLAMASLISPSWAIIPYHVLAQSGLAKDPNMTITVETIGFSTHLESIASVVAADESANIALLELASHVNFKLPSTFLPLENVAPAGKWNSYCVHPTRGALNLTGSFGGPFTWQDREYQTLQLDTPMPNMKDVSGAPVIWNDQLVGIVALANNEGSSWYVTLISQRLIQELEAASFKASKAGDWLSKEDIESFSPAAREILGRADKLRQNRKLRGVTMGILVASLAQQGGGQLSVLLRNMKIDVNEIVPTDDPRNTLSDIIEELGFPPISRSVRRVLIGARDKAKALGSKEIDESHILFAALKAPDHPIIKALRKRGITPDKITFDAVAEPAARSEFLAGVQSDTPAGEDLLDIKDEVEALASVLAAKDADPPLALGLFGEWGSGKSFFMGRLENRIRLLQDDAQKARKEGVESSYCEHIVQLTFNAWNYIDTNLWASLATEIFEGLASAVAKRRGGDSAEQRALVLAAASSSQEVLAETERKKSVAEEELKQTQQRLATLQSNQSNIETNLSPSELFKQAYRFAIAQDEVKKPLEKVAEQLKLREGTAAAGKIKAEILELRGFWTTLLLTLRHGRYSWVWILIFVVMLGLGWGVNHLLEQSRIPALATRALGILTAAGGFLGMFGTWARKALEFVQKAQKSKQELIEQKKQEKTEILQAEYKEVQEKVKKATEAVGSAKETVSKINEQLENMRADRQMADYIRQRNESTDYTQHLGIIARVRTDFRHLSTLLRDVKAQSEEDVLEMKRRQKAKEAERTLAGKAKENVREERAAAKKDVSTDTEDKLFPRIDRIILYIDDLDRCPEKNVFQVLQAVHLLLAFPLFIVVVGVDPRWLLRSLENQTSVFSTDPEQNGNNGEQEPDRLWQSTPMNYLEKIFQIPFTLRPINRAGFGKLVDKFASRKTDPNQEELPIKSTPPSSGKTIKDSTPAPSDEMEANTIPLPGAAIEVSRPVVNQARVVAVQPGTQGTSAIQQPISSAPDKDTKVALPSQETTPPPIDRNPEHLQIEEWERTFMKTLHELIPSPRAGKRFINIYRLIRASMKDTARRKFIGNASGGEYQAAQMLLAILTGYPAEATEILQQLIKEEHPETWGEFMETLRKQIQTEEIAAGPEETKPPKGSAKRINDKEPAIPKQGLDVTLHRLQRWNELFDKLDRRKTDLKGMPCAAFCDWATQIARYSFQSGRVMLYQRDESQPSLTMKASRQ